LRVLRQRRAVGRQAAAEARADTKPCSASRMAGSNNRAQGRRPWAWCASLSIGTRAGVPIERPLACAVSKAIGAPFDQEHVRRRAGRRPLAAVVGIHRFVAVRAVMDQEPAAADARRFRLHQPQRHFDSDRGVHRAAALAQDLQPRGSTASGSASSSIFCAVSSETFWVRDTEWPRNTSSWFSP
jgi:hypothetical protein